MQITFNLLSPVKIANFQIISSFLHLGQRAKLPAHLLDAESEVR
jgi:hypothetical protein